MKTGRSGILRHWPWILAALVAVGVLREIGAVNLNLYWSEAHKTRTANMRNPEALKKARTGWSTFELPDGNLQVNITRADAPAVNLTTERIRYEVDAASWMPIFKLGSCEYEVGYTCDALDVSGKIEGTVELKVMGLCSSHHYRTMLREKVDEEVRGYLEKQLRSSL